MVQILVIILFKYQKMCRKNKHLARSERKINGDVNFILKSVFPASLRYLFIYFPNEGKNPHWKLKARIDGNAGWFIDI